MLRHILAWKRGETNDPESGLPHLAHAGWNCIALMHYGRYGLGEDDRVGNLELGTEYVAGLLDGEGSIHVSKSIHPKSKRPQYSLALTITNTDWLIIHQIMEKYGGHIETPPMEGKLGKRQVYVWSINSKKATSILTEVYPYLRIKKLEALEALEFQKCLRAPGENSPLTEEEIACRENHYQTLKELKRLPINTGG